MTIDAPMEAAEFAAIGAALYGPEWRPSAARLLDCGLSSVKRWANGAYRVPMGVALQMRAAAAGMAAARNLRAIVDAIDIESANGRVAQIRLSEKKGNPIQPLANDIVIAATERVGRRAQFERIETAAETPEERALEAALGRLGSRA